MKCECEADGAVVEMIERTIDAYIVDPIQDPVGFGVLSGMLMGLALARFAPEYALHLYRHMSEHIRPPEGGTVADVREQHRAQVWELASEYPAREAA